MVTKRAQGTNLSKQLIDKIKNRSAKVGVIGLGYVGLPLSVELAKDGFKVTGFDVSKAKVKLLNAGKSDIDDVPDSDATVFYRYDTYTETGAADFDRHVIGGYWELDRTQRITLEVDSYDDGGTDATDVALRWQFKYK